MYINIDYKVATGVKLQSDPEMDLVGIRTHYLSELISIIGSIAELWVIKLLFTCN